MLQFFTWYFIFSGAPANANLKAERIFYQHYQRLLEGPIPILTVDDLQAIERLTNGDVDRYAQILLDRWVASVGRAERQVLESGLTRVNFEVTEGHPDISFRAYYNAWGPVDLLMPARLRRSVLYYYLVFHELEHRRQSCALFEACDLDLDDLLEGYGFWAKFEFEKSAMSLEWYFLHHLPEWAKVALARDLDQITPQDEFVSLAMAAVRSANLSREDYLQAQWDQGRYSWETLQEDCESELAKGEGEVPAASLPKAYH